MNPVGACYRHGRIMLHDGYCADCRVEKLSEEQEISSRNAVARLKSINEKQAPHWMNCNCVCHGFHDNTGETCPHCRPDLYPDYETSNETRQSQKKSQKKSQK